MSDLFRRDFLININGTQISSSQAPGNELLRVQFKVERTLKKEPNTATIALYNLRKETRVLFQEKELPTILEAGYQGTRQQIFEGNLTFGQNRREATDWITTLEAGDGSTAFRSARVNLSIKGPVTVEEVLRQAAGSLGVALGNIQDRISEGDFRGAISEYTNGKVLSGKAEKQLSKITKTLGLEWSIQNGELLFLKAEDTTNEEVALLSPGTGLIGSPEAGDEGFIKARSLLQPELTPGRRVRLESSEVNGFFRIQKVMFTGDTQGQDWYADIEAKPL